MKFETKAIHVGQEPDPTTGAVITPIYATSTYVQEAPGKHAGYEYSRTDNPTRRALADVLASLEGAGPGGGSVITSSGLAATSLIGWLLAPGDHVLLPNDAYGGTFRFFARVLGEHGVEYSSTDMTSPASLSAGIRPNTKVIWVETPTNPLLRLVDLKEAATLAHDAGALLVVDNTFATPFLQRPLESGADVILHSTTKYMGGHSDVVGGALVTDQPALLERLKFFENAAGPVAGPFDAWLVLRGVKTLALRMERHSINGAAVARFLESDDRVESVFYPGLESHPQHELARRQMSDFGGMVSFVPKGSAEKASEITSRTELFFLAESLGGVESLIELPAAMTHMSVAGTDLEVPAELIRLSVGIEHIDDLIADLDRALG